MYGLLLYCAMSSLAIIFFLVHPVKKRFKNCCSSEGNFLPSVKNNRDDVIGVTWNGTERLCYELWTRSLKPKNAIEIQTQVFGILRVL